MEPQPLCFTYDAREASRSVTALQQVNLDNWNQLVGLRIKQLHLTGTLDLSTAARVISFNAWLAITRRSLAVGNQFVSEPKGRYQVKLSDESTVTITATLTCVNDFGALAIEMLELLRPMHEAQQ